ncbi:MAG: sigma-70 family RNA polymerase sigma factor [Bacteroidales bacterium]|nr:sigma-70 family RNA polymerase sigma factor [Bacteroidales bacterium]
MGQINDISLIAQVVAFGNKRAFDKLVCKYQSPLRRFFLNLTCGDTALSDDLAQETFIKAYTSLSSFKNLSGFSTWLFRIGYNQFYDYLRSQKETSDLEAAEVDGEYKVEQVSLSSKMDVYCALKTLKEAERMCITLFYMEDMSIDKIADVTGYPMGTVKSHLSRGREKMTTYLKNNGYDERQ